MSKWKPVKLGEICEIVTGSTPSTLKQEYWDGSFYWVTPAEISDGDYYIERTQRKLTEAGISSAGLRIMPVGTVLLSSRAPIGKVAITAGSLLLHCYWRLARSCGWFHLVSVVLRRTG